MVIPGEVVGGEVDEDKHRAMTFDLERSPEGVVVKENIRSAGPVRSDWASRKCSMPVDVESAGAGKAPNQE